jgi:N-acetylmuramoyl-L-alanine amidase
VWVLSQHGASSAMARWLAESENASDRYAPLRDSALYTRDPALSKVLVDMSMDATIASSLDLGRLMIDDLQQVTRIHQQRVDQAGFAVLKSPDIPSILVETGFMSNADDCRRLVTATHQQELAEALKSGIAGYFRQYPVQGPPA